MIFSGALCMDALHHPGPGEIQGAPPLVTVWMHTPAGEDFPFNQIGPNVQTLGGLCIFSSQ